MDEWAKIFYMKYDQLVETRRLVPLSTLGAMAAKAPRQFRLSFAPDTTNNEKAPWRNGDANKLLYSLTPQHGAASTSTEVCS